jgi:hypothetical protein
LSVQRRESGKSKQAESDSSEAWHEPEGTNLVQMDGYRMDKITLLTGCFVSVAAPERIVAQQIHPPVMPLKRSWGEAKVCALFFLC